MPAIRGRLVERFRRAADQAQPHPGRGMGARQRHPDCVRYAGHHHGPRARARRIRGAERRQRVGPPLEPLDKAVDRAGLRGALVIAALDLRRPDQRAQKGRHQPGVRRLRIVPERVERRLAGQTGDIENGIAQRLDRNAMAQGGHADRAVDRDDPGGVAQQLVGVPPSSARTSSATPKCPASRAMSRLQPISPLSSG